MSNSFKRSNYAYWCGSDQGHSIWKRAYNRSMRRVNKQRVALGKEPKTLDEVANPWSSPHDGSAYWYPDSDSRLVKIHRFGYVHYKILNHSQYMDKVRRK